MSLVIIFMNIVWYTFIADYATTPSKKLPCITVRNYKPKTNIKHYYCEFGLFPRYIFLVHSHVFFVYFVHFVYVTRREVFKFMLNNLLLDSFAVCVYDVILCALVCNKICLN